MGIYYKYPLIGIGLPNPQQLINTLAIKRPRHLLREYIGPRRLLK